MDEIDVTCGACGGELRVERGTQAARCPHCGAGLNVPADCAAGSVLAASAEEPGSSIHGAGEQGIGEITVPSSIKTPDFRQWGGVAEEPASSESSVALASEIESPRPVESAPEPPSEKSLARPIPLDGAARPRTSPKRADAAGSRSEAEGGVSRGAFLGLVVFASIMTAMCLGLAYLLITNRQRQLESLPDVVPQQNEDGEIARAVVPIDAELPPGHRLTLGTSQRYGDLLVTPLAVTREPLEFTHYHGAETREPAGEVLKLWVEFKHVGDGPAFAPLDRALLFYRVPGLGPLKANNFLARRTEQGMRDLIAIYDHPPASDWDLTEQELGTVLEPGESWRTFVPSETGVAELDGAWVWRLHLRKGIAENGWGVTTLVEVEIDADDIETNNPV